MTKRSAQAKKLLEQRQILASELPPRSEEHTSELQSQSNLVCRLLLEKKTQPASSLCRLSATRYASASVSLALAQPHTTGTSHQSCPATRPPRGGGAPASVRPTRVLMP